MHPASYLKILLLLVFTITGLTYGQSSEDLKAEPDRLKAEPDRLKAEPDRLKAEPDRLKAEPDRLKAELSRLNREKTGHLNSVEKINKRIREINKKLAEIEFKEYGDRRMIVGTVKSSWMREKPYILSEQVVTVPKGNTVVVTSYYPAEKAWKTEFGEHSGYISDECINQNPFVVKKKKYENEQYVLRKKKARKKPKPKNVQVRKKPAKPIEGRIKNIPARDSFSESQRRKALTAKYGKVTGNKIANGYYWIGMTDQMARESLGRPGKINRTAKSNLLHEQWVYRSHNLYLYFDNGVLKSFQDN